MRWRAQQIRGFYGVVDRPSVSLCRAILSAAHVIQVRRKPATGAERLEIAMLARRVSAQCNALLVVNDDIDLAHRVGADGVHLGQTDERLSRARRRTDLFLGISTHTPEQLAAALADGADYVAYGPIFATTTKANPDNVVGLAGLADAVRLAGSTPVVAIGGITGDRTKDVHATGAAAAAVISWVNGAADVSEHARRIAEPWGRVRERG